MRPTGAFPAETPVTANLVALAQSASSPDSLAAPTAARAM